jgi:hypothetical protein
VDRVVSDQKKFWERGKHPADAKHSDFHLTFMSTLTTLTTLTKPVFMRLSDA